MTDITRRDAVKILGATIIAAPLYPMTEAGAEEKASPSTQHLLTELRKQASDFERLEAPTLLDGTYSKLFQLMPTSQQMERVARVRMAIYNPTDFDNVAGQRFVWNFEPHERGFFFHVVHNDDPRTHINGTRVARLADVHDALVNIAKMHQAEREQDAASVFNKATWYDPSVAGDGVSLCSHNHPCDLGVWSNRLDPDMPLDGTSLTLALNHIHTKSVDDANLKILNEGVRLIVPTNLKDAASRALADIDHERFPRIEREPVVWDRLINDRNWFVQTAVGMGLVHFERHPFTLNCEADMLTDSVIVHSYERRIFGCPDPRAVLGSLPDLQQQGVRT